MFTDPGAILRASWCGQSSALRRPTFMIRRSIHSTATCSRIKESSSSRVASAIPIASETWNLAMATRSRPLHGCASRRSRRRKRIRIAGTRAGPIPAIAVRCASHLVGHQAIAEFIHCHEGASDVRRILGVRVLAKKHGPTVVEDASNAHSGAAGAAPGRSAHPLSRSLPRPHRSHDKRP
jgi:hypothetical protein